jgi:hypothetical protein
MKEIENLEWRKQIDFSLEKEEIVENHFCKKMNGQLYLNHGICHES